MVSKARAKGVYSGLDAGDVVEWLTALASAGCTAATRTTVPLPASLLVAADVFVYIGDLAPVLRASSHVLGPGGLFAFSTEALRLPEAAPGAGAGHPGYTLTENGRFAHTRAYVAATAGACGFGVARQVSCEIRRNAGLPVWGDLFVLAKAAE